MFNKISQAMLAAIVLAAFSSVAQSQDAAKKTGVKARFVFIYTMEAAWKGKPLSEMPFAEHSRYVEKLAKEKKLLVGGPFKDLSGAILIIQADSEAEARQIMENDPIVKDKVVKAEIHAWHAAIKGCVE